jgi:CheY-like chemotaxis protein
MPGQKTKVLLVDDDGDLRKVLAALLTQCGYSVRTARDGFRALHELREEVPEILISDLNMPEMSGFELLSVVRRRFPAIRVIAMSGAFAGEAVPLCVAAEAFYEKGTSPRALLAFLTQLADLEVGKNVQMARSATPIWILRTGSDSGEEIHVLVACPECLRAFESVLTAGAEVIRRIECAHCLEMIEFVTVMSNGSLPKSLLALPARSRQPIRIGSTA